MKIVMIKAREGTNFKPGDLMEVSREEFLPLYEDGYAVTATEYDASQTVIKAREAAIDAEIAKAVEREAILPKDETNKNRIRAMAIKMETADAGVGIEYVKSIKGKEDKVLAARITKAMDENHDVISGSGITYQGVSVKDACHAYITAREPMNKLIRAGGEAGIKEAAKIAMDTAVIMRSHVTPYIKASGDFRLQDIVRGADTTVTGLGTVATGLVLPRNLGYLMNKLAFLKFISTDLSNQGALFNQPVFTRYITPPVVLTYVNGVGYTNGSGDTTQNKSNTGTNASATLTTDVTVTLDQNKAVEIEFGENVIGSSPRNFFTEMQGAQMYSLAEAITKFFMAKIFAATWTGTVASYTKSLGNFDIKGLVGIKNAMSLSLIPDVGRFLLLHSTYYDKLLEDSNLVLANTILAALNKDSSVLQEGQLPPIFGLHPMESQLAAADSSGVLVNITDPSNITAAMVGFAGNMSSMLFVSRIPNDYTKVLPNVPETAAIEIVTEPNSGLSMMGVRYINHTTASASGRYALMYGAAQGDPRQGIIVKPQ